MKVLSPISLTVCIRTLLLWAIAVLSFTSPAQHPSLRHFIMENGLPSSEVYHAMQDSKGYLWFSTDRGVARFNGYEFETFASAQGLPDNTVFETYEDHRGRIWMISYSNRLTYYYEGKIHRYEHDSIAASLFQGAPKQLSFYVDESDGVHIGFSIQGEATISKTGELIYPQSAENVIGLRKQGAIDFLHVYKSNAAPSQKWNLETGTDNYPTTIQIPQHYRTPWIRAACIRANGDLILGADHEIIRIKDSLQFFPFERQPSWIFEDQQQLLWIGFDKGGVKCFRDSNLQESVFPTFLEGKTVSHILQDREGGFWFCTREDGVYYLPSLIFKTYQKSLNGTGDRVSCLTVDSAGTVYAGHESGFVDVFERSGKRFQIPISTDSINILSGVYASEKKGGAWICGQHDIFHYSDSQLSVLPHTVQKTADRRITTESSWGFWADQDNISWSGNGAGLVRWKDDQVDRFYPAPRKSFRTNAIFKDSQQQLWVGSLDGLWKLQEDTLVSLKHRHPLLSSRIVAINELAQGILLLSSRGQGLIVMTNDTLFAINQQMGLASDFVNGTAIENDSTIWIATSRGLNRLVLAQHRIMEIKTFTTQHGLPSNEINEVILWKNEIWAASQRGITVFNGNEIFTNPVEPPVYITAVNIANHDTAILPSYQLSHHQSVIQISFTGISFRSAGSLVYRYRIKGLEEAWHEINTRTVLLSGLKPGSYQVEVTARNEDGVWNRTPAQLSIEIASPFWLTWWFSSLIGALTIAAIGFIFYLHFRRLSKQRKIEQRMIGLERKALSAQMNPHFIFNALNVVQSLITEDKMREAEMALICFSKLVRQILYNSRDSMVLLSKEIEMLELYLELESLRFGGQLRYEFEIDSELDGDSIQIPSMLLQPYIENAVVHGLRNRPDGGLVKVSVTPQNSFILCSVTDNGIGREQAAAQSQHRANHHSVGMLISKERLELVNKELASELSVQVKDRLDDNGKLVGTSVEVLIPRIEV